MDCLRVTKDPVGQANQGIFQLSLDMVLGRTEDIVIRGGKFVAYYDCSTGFWKTKDYFYDYCFDILNKAAEVERIEHPTQTIIVRNPAFLASKFYTKLQAFEKAQDDSKVLFDQRVIWASESPKKEDYSTQKMEYDISTADPVNYDKLMSILYAPEDRTMLEWLAGAALCGEGRKIDKFCFLEGTPGSGKSTFFNVLSDVFGPYCKPVEIGKMGDAHNDFATAQLKTAPLIGVDHDGDLSHIETNTILNRLISHEPIVINEKFERGVPLALNTLLFIGSNEPLRLTSSMSGLLRRCLDPVPTGKLLPKEKWEKYTEGARHELGAIANRFISVYKELGDKAYAKYRSSRIVRSGNAIGYWVERYRAREWKRDDECRLSDEYSMYRSYCDGASVKPISKQMFERQILFFWQTMQEEEGENGTMDARFFGYQWRTTAFKKPVYSKYVMSEERCEPNEDWLSFTVNEDFIFSDTNKDMDAQYATEGGFPREKWADVKTKLENIDSRELHYVRMQPNHIVIDFDCRDAGGGKSLAVNIEKIKELGLPMTYGELSKSGQGVHLHYFYDGDPETLTSILDENVEVKVFRGNASLRRKFTFSNGYQIATISSGIPKKAKREDVASEIKDAKHLEFFILKGVRGEYGSHIVTMNFLAKVIDQCYESGSFEYNIEYLRENIVVYARNSTNHAKECEDIAWSLHLVSKNYVDERPIAFFDFEVFKNFNCMAWGLLDSDQVNCEIFPSAKTIVTFFKTYRVIGYNNKRYDNMIAEAIISGAEPMELYKLSKRLVSGKAFAPKEIQAKSYSDVLDFLNVKQSLKKWELQLGIHHKECKYNWDEPVPEEAFQEVAEYCKNDVAATKIVFLANQDDWNTRKILLAMCGNPPGLNMNSSTNDITAYLIFGSDPHPQDSFVYVDLSKEFPGYSFTIDEKSKIHSEYMGVEPSEGGYVFSAPGYYENIGVADVASMHPTSLIMLNAFGSKYTRRYADLVNARKACKHGDRAALEGNQFGPQILKLVDSGMATFASLKGSLKVPINAVYGETTAKHSNRFRDPRNVDNIVAKRGALMMVTLRRHMIDMGVSVVHIKTDSIKIPNCTEELFQEVSRFGKEYGYDFELEEYYSVFCLFDKANYIGYNVCSGKWDSRGTYFEKYVYKRLFSHEEFAPEDFAMCKTVEDGAIYCGDIFCGKNVNVACVKQGTIGHELKIRNGDAESYVAKTKGYEWVEFEDLLERPDWRDYINFDYYETLVAKAVEKIEKYVPFEAFVERATALEPLMKGL